MNLLSSANLDLVEAWDMSWGEGIQFILVLVFLYWLKQTMDYRQQRKISKTIVHKVKIVEE
jgi:hypothetical protein